MISRSIFACMSGSMHPPHNPSSSRFALSIARPFYPPHRRRSVPSPSQYRFQSALPSPSPVSTISVRLFRGSSSFTFPVDSMRKPPGELVRIVWRGAILDRTYSEFFALPSPETIVPPRPLYTIIGRRKQCARPGKRMRSLAIRLANYVKHHVRATLGYLGEIASRVLLRPVPLCEINRVVRKEVHPMHREIGSPAIASCFMPLFLECEGRDREKGITRRMARLTVTIPLRHRGLGGPNCTLLHFSTAE